MRREQLRGWYSTASAQRWALGQFNLENLEFVQALAAAAMASRSPAIAAASAKTLDYMDPESFVATVRAVSRSMPAIYIHLDHGTDLELAAQCIEAGFDSVMYDGSSLPYDENVRRTAEVAALAAVHDVFVEGELGHVGGKEGDEASHPLTDPQQAVEYVKRTGVDALAVAVGTSHGAYKSSSSRGLELELIEQLAAQLPVPLVLHGASGVDPEVVASINAHGGSLKGASGVPDEQLRAAIERGISKVNVATELRLAFLQGLRETLTQEPSGIDPRRYLGQARQAVARTISAKMRLLGSAGRTRTGLSGEG